VKIGSQTIRENVYRGAICGLVAWTAYAVVEYWFSSVLPWVIRPTEFNIPVDPTMTALLFLIYALMGLIVGGVLGLCLTIGHRLLPYLRNSQPAIFLPAAATFTIVFAFITNLLVYFHIGLSIVGLLLISLLLICGLALSATSEIWSKRLRFVTNPWTISIVLLGLSWMSLKLFENNESQALKAASTGGI